MDGDSIRQLLRADAYQHPVDSPRLLETHISWVLLTGRYAYKIKKPLDFGFLDFSTLEKRNHFCNEELRLNRRFAPDLYLDLVPVCRDGERLSLGGSGEIVDYAVRMQEFEQSCLLDHELEAGAFDAGDAAELGDRVAVLHAGLPVASPDAAGEPGSPQSLQAAVVQNFEQIAPYLQDDALREQLATVECWSRAWMQDNGGQLQQRVSDGMVRECHGDLHLGNIARIDGRYLPFDCIEFNDDFRLFDVQGEIGFLCMDLQQRGHQELAQRCFNAYLERGGDYPGVPLTRFYRCYFAVVRAKVALLAHEPPLTEDTPAWATYRAYMDLASSYASSRSPSLLLMHGVSGSGKSTVAEAMSTLLPAVRLRADVERKRLFGLEALAKSDSEAGGGIYSAAAGEKTFAQLLKMAGAVLRGGETCIVDATFLAAHRRAQFAALAAELGIRHWIISCEATGELLQERVAQRALNGSDASEADLEVLAAQLAASEALSASEQDQSLTVNTSTGSWRAGLAARLVSLGILE
jgi:aminoglycoside phosphotransferase family enzyme